MTRPRENRDAKLRARDARRQHLAGTQLDTTPTRSTRVAFGRVATAALQRSEVVVRALLPDGRREGAEWVARNPLRPDKSVGSFKVNLTSGKWGDFATGDRGTDLVSLAAYVCGLNQRLAAIRLAESLGVHPFE